MLDAVSSSAAACSCVRCDRSSLPCDSWRAAEPTASALPRTSPTISTSLASIRSQRVEQADRARRWLSTRTLLPSSPLRDAVRDAHGRGQRAEDRAQQQEARGVPARPRPIDDRADDDRAVALERLLGVGAHLLRDLDLRLQQRVAGSRSASRRSAARVSISALSAVSNVPACAASSASCSAADHVVAVARELRRRARAPCR